MTVRELISALERLPSDAHVCAESESGPRLDIVDVLADVQDLIHGRVVVLRGRMAPYEEG